MLESTFDSSALQTLIKQQIQDTRAGLVRIRDAADGGDLDVIQRAAHDLKSTFGNLGATEVYECARDLEGACRDARYGAAMDLVAALEGVVQTALAALEARYL